MAEKIGVENLKKAVVLGARLGNLIGKAVDDKGIALFADAKELFDIMPDAKDAFAKHDLMKAELADMDAQEKADLYMEFSKDLQLPQAEVEALVEKCLLTVCKVHDVYMIWKK